jgi:hypothetical protein
MSSTHVEVSTTARVYKLEIHYRRNKRELRTCGTEMCIDTFGHDPLQAHAEAEETNDDV